ncbi:hypothetical protein [Mycolicibacterium houstonense]|nr:hypothetical protein [Mycolicibacterium houstonense]
MAFVLQDVAVVVLPVEFDDDIVAWLPAHTFEPIRLCDWLIGLLPTI